MNKTQPQLATELLGFLADVSNFKGLTNPQARTMSEGFVKLFKDYLDAPEYGRNSVKGQYLGLCNVTACQKPGADYWNLSTRFWYCRDCAEKINYNPREIVCIPHYQLPMHGGLPKADLRSLAFMFLSSTPKAQDGSKPSYEFSEGFWEARNVLLSQLVNAYLYSESCDTSKVAELLVDLQTGSDYTVDTTKRTEYFPEIVKLLRFLNAMKLQMEEKQATSTDLYQTVSELLETFTLRWDAVSQAASEV